MTDAERSYRKMHTIMVHDSRLSGPTPSGDDITPIRVNELTPLSRMVGQVAGSAIRRGTDVRLAILCHGFEDHGELGYGLQLCHETVTLNTVRQLAPLDGLISYGIDIYSCGAAHTASFRAGGHGDGWTLCSRIARATASVVRAAELTQWYNFFDGIGGLFRQPISFGQWEGRVITFDARGQEVASAMSPTS